MRCSSVRPRASSTPSRLAEIFTSDYSSTAYGDSSYPDYLSMKSEPDRRSDRLRRSTTAASSPSRWATRRARARQPRHRRLLRRHRRAAGDRPAARAERSRADAPRVAVIGHDLWRERSNRIRPFSEGRSRLTASQYGIVGVDGCPIYGSRPRAAGWTCGCRSFRRRTCPRNATTGAFRVVGTAEGRARRSTTRRRS